MIKVTHYHGVHQGGTKDYSITIITNKSENVGFVLKRFGKVGADGSMLKAITTAAAADTTLQKLLRERTAKGYDMRHDGTVSRNYDTIHDAIQATLPVVHQRALYNSELAKIDPQNVSADSKAPFDPLKAERDKMFAEQRAEVEAAARRKKEAAEAAEEAELKLNPMFGMF